MYLTSLVHSVWLYRLMQKKESLREVLIDGGREKTGIDIVDWVKEVNELGAGEILTTSVDKEGTRKVWILN